MLEHREEFGSSGGCAFWRQWKGSHEDTQQQESFFFLRRDSADIQSMTPERRYCYGPSTVSLMSAMLMN